LNSELAIKDGQITNLKSKIRELNEYIFQKEKELSDLRKTLKFTKLKEYESELALNVQESKRLRHLLE
jgi:predicted  nucleic acid-binding Zn-ribbon protein